MRILFALILFAFPLLAEEEYKLVMFTPPDGWQAIDPSALPSSVKYMVMGKGAKQFPPSINLGTDRHTGTLKDYLKIVKNINESQGTEWKDLGPIKTEAGQASLSQIDAKTEWGDVRMMHVIYHDEDTAYILTAAALKDEFSKFYQDFFKSMRTFRFCSDPLEVLEKKENALSALKKLNEGIEKLSTAGKDRTQVFETQEFQEQYWEPFASRSAKEYKELGADWQKAWLSKARREVLSSR